MGNFLKKTPKKLSAMEDYVALQSVSVLHIEEVSFGRIE